MDEITRCTGLLLQAIRESEAYLAFQHAAGKLKETPELKKRIDEFRRNSYQLQNSRNSEELYDEVIVQEREFQELSKDPVVHEYLTAELRLCRIIQRCTTEIATVIDLEIGEILDVIES